MEGYFVVPLCVRVETTTTTGDLERDESKRRISNRVEKEESTHKNPTLLAFGARKTENHHTSAALHTLTTTTRTATRELPSLLLCIFAAGCFVARTTRESNHPSHQIQKTKRQHDGSAAFGTGPETNTELL